MSDEREGLFEDIPLSRCSHCQVLWMEPKSLDRLDDNINVEASRLDWHPALRVPSFRCNACPAGYRDGGPRLEGFTLAGSRKVLVHRCSGCEGFLLDESILDELRTALISAT